jgi:hypothetical protein
MDKVKAIKHTGNEDEVMRDHFISGMRDHTLRQELKLKVSENPALTFMRCRKIAIDWMDDEPQQNLDFEPQVNTIQASDIEDEQVIKGD